MPRATLEFDLADFDDAAAHDLAVAAPRLQSTLRNFDERLRRAVHDSALDGKQLTGPEFALVERIRAIMHEEAETAEVLHLLNR